MARIRWAGARDTSVSACGSPTALAPLDHRVDVDELRRSIEATLADAG